jgi:predicted RNA-binding protein with PUA-like domain
MAFWLFKTEPSSYSFDDLARDGSTGWDGVRNYQARNRLRDEVKAGDLVLFYHSSAGPPVIAGVAEVTEPGHADPTAFDPASKYHDPKSNPSEPTWVQVTVRPVCAIAPPLALSSLRESPALSGMELLRKGSRLSIQVVTPAEWAAVMGLAGLPLDPRNGPSDFHSHRERRRGPH